MAPGHVRVDRERLMTAAMRVADTGGDVPVSRVVSATNEGREAVPGSHLAGALTGVGAELRQRLAAFAQACDEWAVTVQRCLAEYDEADATTSGRLDRFRTVPV